ncbi:MAG: glucosyl-3-phosphoglycerate synthase [Ilumatobacter sp.]|nr:glucosyl-3-phosphoglycerate synthase [bacterium]MDG1266683.1 glucosyl-3-phosphoglycerate synthase [Ilumatobacter sp.]MDG2040803.1 glucosyl-3-phosphoglycerate synthase [Ilumatobacter sp.]
MTEPIGGVRTFATTERLDDDVVNAVVAAKAGRTVSVCIPCRDEAATIGPLVSVIRRELMLDIGLVDELIVLDDRSTDDTARVAVHSGAQVVSIDDAHQEHGEGHGKGNALWVTLLVSHGDIVVWCDGDVTSFEPDWVTKLVAPLLNDSSVMMMKALYHRPTNYGGGGRTTELVARPLMSRYFPGLTGLAQPLSGEYAGRRTALERLSFVQGWGVEMGLLIDIEREWGATAIGQVDLGSRLHRHRSLHSLSVQAAEVMATILDRAGVPPVEGEVEQVLQRADGSAVPLNCATRRSLASLGLAREGM